MLKNNRRKNPVSVRPDRPGWYVQWVGRSDWQEVDERTGQWLKRILVSDGDKVLHVEKSR